MRSLSPSESQFRQAAAVPTCLARGGARLEPDARFVGKRAERQERGGTWRRAASGWRQAALHVQCPVAEVLAADGGRVRQTCWATRGGRRGDGGERSGTGKPRGPPPSPSLHSSPSSPGRPAAPATVPDDARPSTCSAAPRGRGLITAALRDAGQYVVGFEVHAAGWPHLPSQAVAVSPVFRLGRQAIPYLRRRLNLLPRPAHWPGCRRWAAAVDAGDDASGTLPADGCCCVDRHSRARMGCSPFPVGCDPPPTTAQSEAAPQHCAQPFLHDRVWAWLGTANLGATRDTPAPVCRVLSRCDPSSRRPISCPGRFAPHHGHHRRQGRRRAPRDSQGRGLP